VDKIFFISRSLTVAMSVLLGFFVCLWSRELFGWNAGIFALFLYVFEPNILAHSRLISTDLGFTCLFFISLYFCWKLLNKPCLKNLLLLCVAVGLAICSKITAILLIPTFFIILLIHSIYHKKIEIPIRFFSRFIEKRNRCKGILSISVLMILVFSFAYTILFMDYGFRFDRLIQREAGVLKLENALEKIPVLSNDIADKIVHFAQELRVPARNYFIKMLYMFDLIPRTDGKSRAAYARYLLGQSSYEGTWYFIFIAMAIKEPIPLLLLLVLAFCAFRKQEFRKYMFLLIPAFVLLASGITMKSFAFRYVNLPLSPFMK